MHVVMSGLMKRTQDPYRVESMSDFHGYDSSPLGYCGVREYVRRACCVCSVCNVCNVWTVCTVYCTVCNVFHEDMSVGVDVFTSVRMYLCTYVRTYVCMSVCLNVCINVCVYIQMCKCVMYVFMLCISKCK